MEVVNPVPPGVEAHDFEPKPDDIRKLNSADLIIYNGSGFEPWIDRALESIDGSESIAIETSRGLVDLASGDPHVWLDPMKAVEQVRLIRDGLSRVDSDRADFYAENADSLITELEQLHARFQGALAEGRLTELLTTQYYIGVLGQA